MIHCLSVPLPRFSQMKKETIGDGMREKRKEKWDILIDYEQRRESYGYLGDIRWLYDR